MQRQRGFSLIEVLVALLILAIVITTTLTMFLERNRRLKMASDTILVYQALQNEAEMRRRIDYDALESSPPAFISNTSMLKPLSDAVALVTVEQQSTDVKLVNMVITWDKGKRIEALRLIRVDTGGQNLW